MAGRAIVSVNDSAPECSVHQAVSSKHARSGAINAPILKGKMS